MPEKIRTMKVNLSRYPTCFWHIDCDKSNHAGILKEVKREEEHSLMECLDCGKLGYYPVGGSGCIEIDVEEA